MAAQGITAVECEPSFSDSGKTQIIVRHGSSAKLVKFDTLEEAKLCYTNIKLQMQDNGCRINNCN